jgi:hypothetical protein
MTINLFSSRELKKALALVEQRETHQSKIAEIDKALEALLGPAHGPESKSRKAVGGKRRSKQGEIKEAIVALLQQAGRPGLSLKKICARLSLSPSSVNSWMHSTGKKIKAIKKIGRGQYAWAG